MSEDIKKLIQIRDRVCEPHDLINHYHIKKLGTKDLFPMSCDPEALLSIDSHGDVHFVCPVCHKPIYAKHVDVERYRQYGNLFKSATFSCANCKTEFYTDPFIMPEHHCSDHIHIDDLGDGMFFDKLEDANPYLYKQETVPVFVKYCPAIFAILWVLFAIGALVALGTAVITVILSWKQQIPLDEKFGICVIVMIAMVAYCVLYVVIENFIDRRYGKIYEVPEEWENRHE